MAVPFSFLTYSVLGHLQPRKEVMEMIRTVISCPHRLFICGPFLLTVKHSYVSNALDGTMRTAPSVSLRSKVVVFLIFSFQNTVLQEFNEKVNERTFFHLSDHGETAT